MLNRNYNNKIKDIHCPKKVGIKRTKRRKKTAKRKKNLKVNLKKRKLHKKVNQQIRN